MRHGLAQSERAAHGQHEIADVDGAAVAQPPRHDSGVSTAMTATSVPRSAHTGPESTSWPAPAVCRSCRASRLRHVPIRQHVGLAAVFHDHPRPRLLDRLAPAVRRATFSASMCTTARFGQPTTFFSRLPCRSRTATSSRPREAGVADLPVRVQGRQEAAYRGLARTAATGTSPQSRDTHAGRRTCRPTVRRLPYRSNQGLRPRPSSTQRWAWVRGANTNPTPSARVSPTTPLGRHPPPIRVRRARPRRRVQLRSRSGVRGCSPHREIDHVAQFGRPEPTRTAFFGLAAASMRIAWRIAAPAERPSGSGDPWLHSSVDPGVPPSVPELILDLFVRDFSTWPTPTDFVLSESSAA